MQDVASLTGTPRVVMLGGEPVTVSPLTVEDLGKLQAWVDAQFPNPYDVVNRELERGRLSIDERGNEARVPYSIEQQKFLLRVAAEQSERGQRLIGTPEADSKLQTVEGMKQLLLISIRKTAPEFSPEDADRLFRRMSLADIEQLLTITNLDMVTSDPPKAPTPSGTATTPATGNRKQRRRARSTGGDSSTRR